MSKKRRPRCKKTIDLFTFARDNRPSIVYMATNTVNSKRYIGLTRMTLEGRRKHHEMHARLGRPQYFVRAIRKYGPDAFVWTVLTECESYKAACVEERRLIAELKPEYNLTQGGEGILGHRHDEATRQKMSAAKKGRSPWPTGQYPAEVRAKISAASKARKGRPLNEKQRAAIRRNYLVGNEVRRRPVICVTDGRAFACSQDAAKEYNISHSTILNCCLGRTRNSQFKLAFLFVEDLWRELDDEPLRLFA